MPNLASHVIPSTGGYEIDQSLRFNDDDSAYLSRTPASAGNRKTWTWSGWVKCCELGQRDLFAAGTNSSNWTALYVSGGNNLILLTMTSGSVVGFHRIAPLYRDTSAWYHFVVVCDTAQATAADRVKFYVNGEQVTDYTSTTLAQNHEGYINAANEHRISAGLTSGAYFDGYLADVHFIDGQALDASYFGETDADYGHWKPIKYEGSYGTNGFYLDFSNSSSLGEDQSGNSNNWTSNNLAATDVVLDSPTNNFATLNPLTVIPIVTAITTLTEGNTKSVATGNSAFRVSTIGLSTGSWYFEGITTGAAPNGDGIGFGNSLSNYAIYRNSGYKLVDGVSTNISGSTWSSNNEICSMTLDADTGQVTAYVNGVSQGVIDTLDMSEPVFALVFNREAGTVSTNFGQDSSFAGTKTAQGNTDANGIGDFYYAPPSGYLALCTQNLPAPTVAPADHFNTVLYTGTNSNQSITGVGFQPDFIWFARRDAGRSLPTYNSVDGANLGSATNETLNYISSASNDLVSFDSDGFTLGPTQNYDATNGSGASIVAWNWKANGTGVSNTDGTITSTVSANVDAGFSIVGWTGTGSDGTVGHGLSQTPDLFILKNRDDTGAWYVYTTVIDGSMDYLFLNTTDAKGNSGLTAPTSTVINVGGSQGGSSVSGEDQIIYAFHSVDGFSKIGTYTGNGSSTDGPFVYTGFRPAWIMYKRTNVSGNSWFIFDVVRDTVNPLDSWLAANLSNAETVNTFGDALSNGFKIRSSLSGFNNSGDTYLFLAFAETPFKFSNGR